MKLIGLVLSLLIVSVLVVLQVRSMTGGEDGKPPLGPTEPDARFKNRCRELAPPKVLRADDYCRCLWQRGVRQLTHLITDPHAKQVSVACQALVAPPPKPDGGAAEGF